DARRRVFAEFGKPLRRDTRQLLLYHFVRVNVGRTVPSRCDGHRQRVEHADDRSLALPRPTLLWDRWLKFRKRPSQQSRDFLLGVGAYVCAAVVKSRPPSAPSLQHPDLLSMKQQYKAPDSRPVL